MAYLAAESFIMSGLTFFIPLLVSAAAMVHVPATDSFKDDSTDMLVMNWNLENFFDWHDGGLSDSDREFSSRGARHWTRSRFEAKANAVAKTVFITADISGRLPDVIAFEEVENRNVLRRLLEDTALRKADYSIVHFESPDKRGIDVALLYRKSSFELEDSRAVTVGDTSLFRTRDILYAGLKRISDGRRFAFLVNHHPSKYGGSDSDWKRKEAVMALKAVCDSLKNVGDNYIIAMGDFNDTPENTVIGLISGEDGGILVNLAAPLALKGEGSIRFNGKWELIDMFLVSREVVLMRPEMKILRLPFLMTHDNVHSGDKPLRTYLGPRYIGGVSDHLPILLKFPP